MLIHPPPPRKESETKFMFRAGQRRGMLITNGIEENPSMMSAQQLEMYRRMSNAERLAFTLRRIREEWPYLTHGKPEVVARRFELLRRQNDERNRNLRLALARQPRSP